MANRKSCNGCFYHMRISGLKDGITRCCHYFLVTGKLLPCPKDKCTEYTKKSKKHRYDFNVGDYFEESVR